MDELGEDDIDILNHEKADSVHRRETEIPIPMYTGDESVASHFALVTAYEDIKKRLKETEKENSLLKKRVRLLEEKFLGSRLEEETHSVVREQVNKAYQAYREACIERDNLKSKLDKMVRDNTESLKTLNEQLQSKEVELLQLKTEVETQQVMKNLNCNPSSWEIDKLNSDLRVHSLEQDLEKLKEECNILRRELQKPMHKDQPQEGNFLNGDFLQCQNIHSENMQQAYWELKREMSNLHLVTEMQAEVLRKLKMTPSATKKAPPCAPVQCAEDLEKNFTKLHLTSSGAVYKKTPSLSDKVPSNVVASSLPRDARSPSERANLQSWTNERPIPVGGMSFQEHNSYGKSSLEDNSWVFPSPPKPSETVFWETKSKVSLTNYPLNFLDQCNQNCLHKS
uniref:5-azacytidine-induced protein 2 n=1 Tax=Sphenodon punctatus TaxID=8508 RepID=A0A8D0HKN9_SPHPU